MRRLSIRPFSFACESEHQIRSFAKCAVYLRGVLSDKVYGCLWMFMVKFKRFKCHSSNQPPKKHSFWPPTSLPSVPPRTVFHSAAPGINGPSLGLPVASCCFVTRTHLNSCADTSKKSSTYSHIHTNDTEKVKQCQTAYARKIDKQQKQDENTIQRVGTLASRLF